MSWRTFRAIAVIEKERVMIVRRKPWPGFFGVCLAVTLACVLVIPDPVLGKPGPAKPSASKPAIKVKVSAEFAHFPLPYAAALVAKSKQKTAKEWTEYRVGMSLVSLAGFYRTNMPGHGWKLKANKGNTWTWTRGNRTIVVMYVRVTALVSLIAVREMR